LSEINTQDGGRLLSTHLGVQAKLYTKAIQITEKAPDKVLV